MLKRKRKINKQALIATSRRYHGPLPLAYAQLLRCGVAPCLAKAMVEDAVLHQIGQPDTSHLPGLVIFHITNYEREWRKVAWL